MMGHAGEEKRWVKRSVVNNTKKKERADIV